VAEEAAAPPAEPAAEAPDEESDGLLKSMSRRLSSAGMGLVNGVAGAVMAPIDVVVSVVSPARQPAAKNIVDAHFHFFDPPNNAHNAFLGSLGPPPYLPEQYAEHADGLPISKTVHVEAMCDSAIGEALWVEGLADAGRCKVAAIVAGVNLASADVEAQLDELTAKCPRVRGNRYIIDYVGPLDGGKNATHPNMIRHDGGIDYLRDPAAAPAFEKGFAALGARGLSFDLQCAPEQLPAAAALCAKYPDVPVVIDHMGKPRHLQADGGDEDAAKLAEWREGMKLMAALPQVHVKLSMLGYAVPGWHADEPKGALLKSLVLETITLFGASRCMFASNFHVSAAGSDSDGKWETGPTMAELYALFEGFVADYSDEDKAMLFAGTAEAFYKI